ncbi:uncharacterized protein LOC144119491 isoform X1 [Amblyomma americanum]
MENVVKKEGPPAKRQRDNSRCSTDQWIVMIDFLCVHKSLSRATSDLSPETRQRLWSELTSLLNAMGPTSKTSEDWHRYWQSRVAAARHRAEELAAAERKRSADGAHAASPIRLSEDDARVLSIVGDELALEVRRGHVVQKRLESPSPASAAASPPPSRPVSKSPPAGCAKCSASRRRSCKCAHTSQSTVTRGAEQGTSQVSTSASKELAARPQISSASLPDNANASAEHKGPDPAAPATFRYQVLKHLEEVEASTSRQLATAERQARAVQELEATLQQILHLLEAGSHQPPPEGKKQ